MLPVQWLAKANINLAAIITYVAERNDVAASELQNDIVRAVSQRKRPLSAVLNAVEN